MRRIANENDIKDIILADNRTMEVLRCAARLDLPDWMIAAGFVRNKMWDELHGFEERTSSGTIDIDLIYFDNRHMEEAREKVYERELRAALAENWSVKNHARISARYGSCEDGISYWPGICTPAAFKLVERDELRIIAPYGVEDLVVRGGRGSMMRENTAAA